MQCIEHRPVMLEEVIRFLKLKPGMCVVDATVGTGGHAEGILKNISPNGRLVGIDRDNESLDIAKGRLKSFGKSFELIHDDFRNIDTILSARGINHIDAILFDLGVSSYQLDEPGRGFSFKQDGPLDMRMDKDSYISAYDLVNNLTEKEISSILKLFGQECWHNRIARFLVKERIKAPIATTGQLKSIVLKAIPYKKGYWRIHPATRTFQAFRIAVNRELEALDNSLKKCIDILHDESRACVISFHSLEDRIVKINFREGARAGRLKIITPKPLRPSYEQIKENSRCRSARLRVAEKIK